MNKKEYTRYLQSKHWQNFKTNYWQEHKQLCSSCGTDKKIGLHHLNYDHLYHELFSDVTPMCKICHEYFHKGIVPKLSKVINSRQYIKRKKSKSKNIRYRKITPVFNKETPAYIPESKKL